MRVANALPATIGVLLLGACAQAPADDDAGAPFRVDPVRPVATLIAEAEAAQPPVEQGEFRDDDLIEPSALEPGILLDVRYATADNFVGTAVYPVARAFLQRPAAEAVGRAHRALAAHGYGLMIHDAYRPWYVTKVFWEATPPSLHDFVADPARGSRHNRGCAVDLTLYDLATGKAVAMPSHYDEMTERAYPDYAGGSAAARARRDLLRRVMEAEGFSVYPTEWWHYDYRDYAAYRIGNRRLEEL